MDEPVRALEEALARVQPSVWDETRTERTLRTLPGRRRRNRVRRLSGALAMGALVLVGALWLGTARDHQAGPHAARAPLTEPQNGSADNSAAAALDHSRAEPQTLADGSSVELRDAHTAVVVEHQSEHRTTLRMGAGRALFRVTPHKERVFQVQTKHVLVEVLGTVFELNQEAERTWVRVEHGRVAVSWGDQRRILVADEAGWFPVAAEGAEAGPLPEEAKAKPTRRSVRTPLVHGAAHSDRATPLVRDQGWRDHAERGDFKRAYPMLPALDTLQSMRVDELLLAADAARLSGHPQAALPFLQHVVRAHADDARAALAAFTLGGVLMHQLGMPREAELAYATAHATSQSTALAQDALARQVEAAHRAGDDALARELARAYLTQYPEGRRVHAVRRFGGL